MAGFIAGTIAAGLEKFDEAEERKRIKEEAELNRLVKEQQLEIQLAQEARAAEMQPIAIQRAEQEIDLAERREQRAADQLGIQKEQLGFQRERVGFERERVGFAREQQAIAIRTEQRTIDEQNRKIAAAGIDVESRYQEISSATTLDDIARIEQEAASSLSYLDAEKQDEFKNLIKTKKSAVAKNEMDRDRRMEDFRNINIKVEQLIKEGKFEEAEKLKSEADDHQQWMIRTFKDSQFFYDTEKNTAQVVPLASEPSTVKRIRSGENPYQLPEGSDVVILDVLENQNFTDFQKYKMLLPSFANAKNPEQLIKDVIPEKYGQVAKLLISELVTKDKKPTGSSVVTVGGQSFKKTEVTAYNNARNKLGRALASANITGDDKKNNTQAWQDLTESQKGTIRAAEFDVRNNPVFIASQQSRSSAAPTAQPSAQPVQTEAVAGQSPMGNELLAMEEAMTPEEAARLDQLSGAINNLPPNATEARRKLNNEIKIIQDGIRARVTNGG